MKKTLLRFIKLTDGERHLLMEALLHLLAARLALRMLSFKRIVALCGRRHTPVQQVSAAEALLPQSISVGWAVEAVSRRLFRKNTCFTKALAAKRMLNRRGISCELRLGVAKDAQGELVAHAWTVAFGKVLTGADVAEGFTALYIF